MFVVMLRAWPEMSTELFITLCKNRFLHYNPSLCCVYWFDQYIYFLDKIDIFKRAEENSLRARDERTLSEKN